MHTGKEVTHVIIAWLHGKPYVYLRN